MDWIEQHVSNLANSSGFDEAEATRLFVRNLHVSIDPELRGNASYLLAFVYAVNLLSRIFPSLTFDDLPISKMPILPWAGMNALRAFSVPELTLRFGRGRPDSTLVVANLHQWRVIIDAEHSPDIAEEWNPVLALLTACYAAGRVCKLLLGDALAGRGVYEPFSILDLGDGDVRFDWTRTREIGHLTLAGIGAIGSAFLFALASHRNVSGRLTLVDHDTLDGPNLCRYTFFNEGDFAISKVSSAKRHLDALGMAIRSEAFDTRFEKYFDQNYQLDPRFRVENLISAPDRRDTRRRFQAKLPRRLWDASTGPNQVVLHHNEYHKDFARLACIYPETPDENAHLKHVAETLNLPFKRILTGDSISQQDAIAIESKYPQLRARDVVGKEFDTVFRQLCSAGEIKAGPSERVLAPLSFVSAMAGIFLYFEVIKSLHPETFGRYQRYNYVFMDPLSNPNPSFRQLRKNRADCACQDSRFRQIFAKVWDQQ